jgi:hypothetical protein
VQKKEQERPASEFLADLRRGNSPRQMGLNLIGVALMVISLLGYLSLHGWTNDLAIWDLFVAYGSVPPEPRAALFTLLVASIAILVLNPISLSYRRLSITLAIATAVITPLIALASLDSALFGLGRALTLLLLVLMVTAFGTAARVLMRPFPALRPPK